LSENGIDGESGPGAHRGNRLHKHQKSVRLLGTKPPREWPAIASRHGERRNAGNANTGADAVPARMAQRIVVLK
jgi:hypothetical protein